VTRNERIEGAICNAGLFIAELMKVGTVDPKQASLLIEAAVRAIVPNATFGEICEGARRIVADLGKRDGREIEQPEDQPGSP
jgi:hypothetical protein